MQLLRCETLFVFVFCFLIKKVKLKMLDCEIRHLFVPIAQWIEQLPLEYQGVIRRENPVLESAKFGGNP